MNLPTAAALIEAASSELAIFERVGRRTLGLQTWDTARKAAEQARRDCWKRLGAQYGARNPHWGWASFALLAAALCAAVAGALASGFRMNPADTAPAVAVLAGLAGLTVLVVSVSSRGRPQGRGFFRLYLVCAIGLAAATAFQLSREVTPTAWAVAASAVLGFGGFIAYLVARAANAEGAEEIDTAITTALTQMQPEVDVIGARIQADVLAQLSDEEQALIVERRANLSLDENIEPAGTPAGGVMIRVLLATWVPEVMREDIARAR